MQLTMARDPSLLECSEMTKPDITGDGSLNTESTSFDRTWNPAETELFHPGDLPVTRRVRAWERRPSSPFTRQKLRTGKIWKRAGLKPANASATSTPGVRGPLLRTLQGAAASPRSPAKAVKKRCVSSELALGTQWERIPSPVKRIITRSAAVEDLVALPEDELAHDEDHGDVEGTLIEVVDVDGRTTDAHTSEEAAEEGWADVEVGFEDFDDRTMLLGEAVQHGPSVAPKASIVEGSTPATQAKDCRASPEPTPDGTSSRDAAPAVVNDHRVATMPAIPIGFVSPVRGEHLPTRRRSEAGRRRTLPRTFAPALLHCDELEKVEAPAELHQSPARAGENVLSETMDELPCSDIVMVEEREEEDEWEDIDVDPEVARQPAGHLPDELNGSVMCTGGISLGNPPMAQDEPPNRAHDNTRENSQDDVNHAARESHNTFDTTPSLPLRRSPRRKSSSPVKPRLHTKTAELPHILAFSPIKAISKINSIESEPAFDGPPETGSEDTIPQSPELPTRSVSAPPEDLQLSPRRSEKPRISDDTALLQAFLSRATERRETSRASVSEQESAVNRRDSDTVRQALSFPAATNVLLEIDPNSPSPRKSASLHGMEPTAESEMQIASPSLDQPGDAAAEATILPRNRRSGRDRRRAERRVPSASNKMTRRGIDEMLTERGEARELATLTRNNTRKNKDTAVLPRILLPRLARVDQPSGSPEPAEIRLAGTSKSVKWDETLAYFQICPPQFIPLEFEDPEPGAPQEQPSLPSGGTDAPAPPAPADTPSRPRIRRLKLPRTVGTPSKVPTEPSSSAHQPADQPVDQPAEVAEAPPPTKPRPPKRSRIATPAKGLGSESLLPDDLPSRPRETQTPAQKGAEPRRKATLKLKAPPSLVADAAPSLPAGPGEPEPGLISSPPKRRMSSVRGLGFAPKLDFAKPAIDVQPTARPEGSGLMSPPKKARKITVFGTKISHALGEEGHAKGKETPGLSSPAKKRTRRVG